MAQDASAPLVHPDEAPAFTAHLSGRAGVVHNEAAFRHFLTIERRRAEQSGRTVLLVLVALQRTPGRNQRLTPQTAAAIFGALGSSVREVDFVGWFRDGQVAAAALIHRGRPQPDAIAERITNMLKTGLRDEDAGLRLRIVPLGAHTGSR